MAMSEPRDVKAWPTSDDGYNVTIHNECGHEPVRWNVQPPIHESSLPRPGWFGMCICDDNRERQSSHVTYDACVVLHLVDQVGEVERLRGALAEIVRVEPQSAASRLDVTEWADALDRAQRIASDALEDDNG